MGSCFCQFQIAEDYITHDPQPPLHGEKHNSHNFTAVIVKLIRVVLWANVAATHFDASSQCAQCCGGKASRPLSRDPNREVKLYPSSSSPLLIKTIKWDWSGCLSSAIRATMTQPEL